MLSAFAVRLRCYVHRPGQGAGSALSSHGDGDTPVELALATASHDAAAGHDLQAQTFCENIRLGSVVVFD